MAGIIYLNTLTVFFYFTKKRNSLGAKNLQVFLIMESEYVMHELSPQENFTT